MYLLAGLYLRKDDIIALHFDLIKEANMFMERAQRNDSAAGFAGADEGHKILPDYTWSLIL